MPSASIVILRSRSFGQHLNALAFDLRVLEHGCDQFFFMTQDFGLLHLDFLLFLDLPDLHCFHHHLLLHHVGLNVVSFIGLRLLALDGLDVLRLLDFKIALRFGLRGERKCFRQNALLIGLRPAPPRPPASLPRAGWRYRARLRRSPHRHPA